MKNYDMGVAIADFDNDGYQDIFVTGFPNCTLYRNNGNGTFTDVTADAGFRTRDDGPRALLGVITSGIQVASSLPINRYHRIVEHVTK